MSKTRVPKLPSMREIGTYDGKIPAERYFRRLGHTLKHVNDGEHVDSSTYISMFELALDGDAAVFAETSFQIRSIMSRASKGVASDKDLEDLQRTFSVRYPPAAEEKRTIIWPDIDVHQAKGENLTGYFNRVLNFYQRAGGQEKSTTSLESLSPSELFMLHQFISKFIRGLHDKTLMQEAVGQRALAANSLQEAHDIVHEAATVLESKASLAYLSARDTRVSQLQELIRVQNGCSADEMISRTFSSAYANAEACRTPCVEPVLPPVAETTNQYADGTASLPQEQDFIDEPVARAAPADAVIGVRHASADAESSSSIMPFCHLFQCGVFGLKFFAERLSIPISLLDIWQTNAKLFRQFRRLSLRISYPRKRTRKKLRR
ncbi:hypothetical protein E4U59_004665 [Claviceps monticola]|nr:hypothetical protein E4U59_004665 [Claviceps monticola]